MKATVLQENLVKALSFVNKAVSAKTQLPILGNVLLETKPGQVVVSATNLETSISCKIGAEINDEGAITVPARLLTELVSSFSHDKIEMKLNQSTPEIVCGQSEATLVGIDAKEFPPLPFPGEEPSAEFEGKQLEKSLPLVLTAVSTDEGRPLLTGVKFLPKDDSLVLAATDGFRLSVKSLPKISGINEEFVVPSRALAEASRAASDTKSEKLDVYLSRDKNQILFLLPSMQIATRLIEGEYPAYEKIIPAGFVTRTTFVREELLRATKLAAVYAKETANILRLDFKKDLVIVSANSPQVGENKTQLGVKTEGETGEIAFNTRFFLDILTVFPEEEIVFEMSGPLAPGVFKSPNDDTFLHIIMPVRVQS